MSASFIGLLSSTLFSIFLINESQYKKDTSREQERGETIEVFFEDDSNIKREAHVMLGRLFMNTFNSFNNASILVISMEKLEQIKEQEQSGESLSLERWYAIVKIMEEFSHDSTALGDDSQESVDYAHEILGRLAFVYWRSKCNVQCKNTIKKLYDTIASYFSGKIPCTTMVKSAQITLETVEEMLGYSLED